MPATRDSAVGAYVCVGGGPACWVWRVGVRDPFAPASSLPSYPQWIPCEEAQKVAIESEEEDTDEMGI